MASIACSSNNFWFYLSDFFGKYGSDCGFVAEMYFNLFFSLVAIPILILFLSGIVNIFTNKDKSYKKTLKKIIKYSIYSIVIFIIFFAFFKFIQNSIQSKQQNEAQKRTLDLRNKYGDFNF